MTTETANRARCQAGLRLYHTLSNNVRIGVRDFSCEQIDEAIAAARAEGIAAASVRLCIAEETVSLWFLAASIPPQPEPRYFSNSQLKEYRASRNAEARRKASARKREAASVRMREDAERCARIAATMERTFRAADREAFIRLAVDLLERGERPAIVDGYCYLGGEWMPRGIVAAARREMEVAP